MRRQEVDSSSIAAIGYDSERRELEIEFRQSGDVYKYFDVSPEEYQAFMSDESKGQYLNRVFKARQHQYIRVSQR
jgi:hypothetical protein